MKVPESCDIFCAVIDNYGDIGVSWRLARQLSSEYGMAVRLWVDELAALQRIWPVVDTTRPQQCVAGVDVRAWDESWAAVEPAAIAIEAFGCQLPPAYIAAMAQRRPQSIWINLEYLSAESWVLDCHGLASPQPPGFPAKYFFFPGFVAGTGGLLLERGLLSQRETFQRSPAVVARQLADWGVPSAVLHALVQPAQFLSPDAPVSPALLVSLFAYENAALPELLTAWSESDRPVVCLVPEGRLLGAIARFFGAAELQPGAVSCRGALTTVVLPFLKQDEYDRLLWSCDLNFVRGEDSFVRAQWAARPFVWHIYPQPEEAHWPKLQAFLDLYCAALDSEGRALDRPHQASGESPGMQAAAAGALAEFWKAWNGAGEIGPAWRALAPRLPALREAAPAWPAALAARGNLAAALAQFCANHV